MDDSVASISPGDDVKPYRIHVSSKYLDLTKKKLELTRLPHEVLLPTSQEWAQGTPKSAIEPLIDYWLENYNWRSQENHYNTTLPQFRTALTIQSSPTPIRIHFIHFKSPHAHALPLLLLPSFPLTNLSLVPLFEPLSNPDNPQDVQPYHVIAPSIPGLGFSDGFTSAPETQTLLENTAHIFNSLMLKLGYDYYVASSSGSGSFSPANIDYHLPRILALNFSEHCLGIHLIDPPVRAPTFSTSPWHWTKFAIAKFFHAPIFGYTAIDWARQSGTRSLSLTQRQTDNPQPPQDSASQSAPVPASTLASNPTSSPVDLGGSWYGAIGVLGLREPNTLAYALCDSPVGLLSIVLNGLRRISPENTLGNKEIIDLTQLAWLPGPEGAMRYWSGAEAESGKETKLSKTPAAVTVFVDNDDYRSPTWAQTKHEVVWAKRQPGRGGLVAWEQIPCITEGIRALTAEVVKRDVRLSTTRLEEVVIDNVIVEEDETNPGDEIEMDAQSPDTVVLSPVA